MKLGSNLDFANRQALNLVFHQLTGAPASPTPGQAYFNTTLNMSFIWNGTGWRPMDAAGLSDGSVPIAALAVDTRVRSTHTGQQPASTISDLSTVVKGYTLDSSAAPVATVAFGSQRLTGLGSATQPTDAVPFQQMQQAIAAAVAGQTAVKNPVRAVATSNISTLSGTPTIDGVALAAGDRVLLTAQTTGAQNGIYVVAAGAWAFASDAASAGQLIEGTDVLVNEGTTYAGSNFRVTTTGTITPGTTAVTWVQTYKIASYTADGVTLSITGTQFSAKLGAGVTTDANGLAVDRAKVQFRFVGTITGDGSTTSFPFTHGLGTAACHVTVRDSSGNQWLVDNTVTATTATVSFGAGAAPAANVTFTVIITG